MVTRNASVNSFEVTIEGHLAKVDYRMSGNRMIITHTEVPEALRGKGVAEQLVAFAVKYARKHGLEVVAECDYANRFLNRDAIASATRGSRLPAIPDDLFSVQPLIYRATDQAFLLYSVGVNGLD